MDNPAHGHGQRFYFIHLFIFVNVFTEQSTFLEIQSKKCRKGKFSLKAECELHKNHLMEHLVGKITPNLVSNSASNCKLRLAQTWALILMEPSTVRHEK